MTLLNGWTGGPFSTATPAVALVSRIVTFRGALNGGLSPHLFDLPLAESPATDVYVAVDLCNSVTGRLLVHPTGEVDVQVPNSFSDAQCFISLDGVSFSLSEKGAQPLALTDGWMSAPFATSIPAARTVAGVVHLQGAVNGGADSIIGFLPKAFSPKADTLIPVDTCLATSTAVHIPTTGRVDVVGDTTKFAHAQCFLSFDGLTYSKSKSGYKPVTMLNGWQTFGGVGEQVASVHRSGKVVRFAGNIQNGTANPVFVLPAIDRPTTDVYLVVEMGPGNTGRLHISPSGDVEVQADSFATAQTFTSLTGAWFAQ